MEYPSKINLENEGEEERKERTNGEEGNGRKKEKEGKKMVK